MVKHSHNLHCGAHGLGSVPSCLSLLPSQLPEGVPGMDTPPQLPGNLLTDSKTISKSIWAWLLLILTELLHLSQAHLLHPSSSSLGVPGFNPQDFQDPKKQAECDEKPSTWKAASVLELFQ